MKRIILGLLLMLLPSQVLAAFVLTPPDLTMVIPVGQTTVWSTIVGKNTGTTPITVTWLDTLNCLTGLTPLTRTIAPGASSNFTIMARCTQTGTATVGGLVVPISITNAVVPPATVPGKVTGVTVVSKTSVTLQWIPNTESDLAGYKVYIRKAGGAYTTGITSVATTFNVSDLLPKTTYLFVVTAYDSVGNESPFSSEVSYTTS